MKTSTQRIALASITLMAAALLTACDEATVDNKVNAETQIHNLVQSDVQPSHNENQYRANIQLTRTNLLSMLPDLAEYPLLNDAADSADTEAAEIFTSADKAGKGMDGVYLELAEQFNQQHQTLSNGKKARLPSASSIPAWGRNSS